MAAQPPARPMQASLRSAECFISCTQLLALLTSCICIRLSYFLQLVPSNAPVLFYYVDGKLTTRAFRPYHTVIAVQSSLESIQRRRGGRSGSRQRRWPPRSSAGAWPRWSSRPISARCDRMRAWLARLRLNAAHSVPAPGDACIWSRARKTLRTLHVLVRTPLVGRQT